MKVLPSPPLVPSSMEGGNMVTTPALQTLANPGAPGSPPVTPMPSPGLLSGAENLPAPQLGAAMPVNPQAGQDGATGLSGSLPHVPEGGADGAPWPAGDQGIDAGPWKKTPGF